MKKSSSFRLLLIAPSLLLSACGYGLKEVYKGVPYTSSVFKENYFNEWNASINPYAEGHRITKTEEMRTIDDSYKMFTSIDDTNFHDLDSNWVDYAYTYDKVLPTDGTKAYGPTVRLSNYDDSFKYGITSKMFDGQMFCNGDFENSRTQVECNNEDSGKGFGVLFSKECNDASYFMMNFKCSLVTETNQNIPGKTAGGEKSEFELYVSFILKNDTGYTYVPTKALLSNVPTNSGDDHGAPPFSGRIGAYTCFGFSLAGLNLNRLIGFTVQYKRISDTLSPYFPDEKTYHAIMLYEVSFPYTTWH